MSASSTFRRAGSNSGPRKFTRRSFTGTPPHSSFRAGTTIASFGSLVDRFLEALEEQVHIPPLSARHLRDEVLHVPEDDEGLRGVLGGEGLDLPRHLLRLGRDVNTRLSELFLEPDVQVRDREDAPVDQ